MMFIPIDIKILKICKQIGEIIRSGILVVLQIRHSIIPQLKTFLLFLPWAKTIT